MMDSLRKAWELFADQVELNLNELQTREEKIGNREKIVEEKESKLQSFDDLIESKEEKCDAFEEVIIEKEIKVEEKRVELDGLEKQILEVEDLIRKKERECELILDRVEDGRIRLCSVEKSFKEMNLKMETAMEDWSCKAELKERQLEGLLERNVEQLQLTFNKIREYTDEVESKERGLEQQSKDIRLKQREVDLKSEEVKLAEMRVKVQLKDRQFDSMEKTPEVHKQRSDSVSLDLQRKQKALVEQTEELKSMLKQSTSQMKTEHFESTPASDHTFFSSPPNHKDALRSPTDLETRSTSKRGASDADEASVSKAKGSMKKQKTENKSSIDSKVKATSKKSSKSPAKVPAEDQVKCITGKKAKGEPSREDVRAVLVDILKEVNFNNETLSDILRRIGTHFGIDLMHRKGEVKEIFTEIYNMNGEEDEEKAGGCEDSYNDNELDSKHKQLNSQTKTHLVSTPSGDHKSAPAPAINKHDEPGSSLGRHAMDVPGLFYQNFCGIDAVQNEFASSLQSVPDPAEFVLSSIRKSLVPYFRKGHYEESVMSRNISILKELMLVTPHVGSYLKEDATYLVSQWKAKMAHSESSVESLAFLVFIAIYGLISLLNGYEIVKLLGLISQSKTALESCQTHGFAPKMADFIRNLIDKDQVIEAVRFIYTFKLVDQLPPVPVLVKYVQDTKKFSESFRSKSTALDKKVKAVDNRIGDLQAVQQCIKDYSLENEYPCAEVEVVVVHLQRIKGNLRRLAPSGASAINVKQQDERNRKKPSPGSSGL